MRDLPEHVRRNPVDCELAHAAPRPLTARAEGEDVTQVCQAASIRRPVAFETNTDEYESTRRK